VFVIVCTARRKRLLARPAVHELLRRAWSATTTWGVGRYVILPDHIHLFCSPSDDDVPLLVWVRYWKALVSRRWPWPGEHPIWQRDCWDTQLRGDETYEAKWEYVRNNPVRHGLVARPEAWPYAGDLEDFEA
jgi:REP element-mobilizing transposase RayT